MFILDIGNIIYLFKISTKEVLCSYQLTRDKNYHQFEIINNKFIYFISEEGLIFTKIKIGINDDGKFVLEKIKENQIKIDLNNKNSITDIIPKRLSSNFIIINNLLILGLNKLLIIYNILTEEIEIIPFKKNIKNNKDIGRLNIFE